jgi:hypothetical protein
VALRAGDPFSPADYPAMQIVPRATPAHPSAPLRADLIRTARATIHRMHQLASGCEDTAATFRAMAAQKGLHAGCYHRRAAALEHIAAGARRCAEHEQHHIDLWSQPDNADDGHTPGPPPS